VEQGGEPVEAGGERVRGIRVDLDAGRDAVAECRLVGVDHRVGQPAHARHHRHATIAQAVELGQAAGFEARRHGDRVGAALHEVRERLVVAVDAADLPGVIAHGGPEAGLDLGIAAAEHGQLAAVLQQARQGREQQVDTLLPGQPADHAHQRTAGIVCQAEACAQRRLVGGPVAQCACGVGRLEVRVRARIPDVQVNAVDYADQPVRARGQEALEPHAARRCADLARVGRADRADHVGVEEPGLQEADAAVVLDAVGRERRRRQAQRAEQADRELALEGQVVHGHDRGRPVAVGKGEVGRCEASLPVVRVDDVGLPGLQPTEPDLARGPGERGEALGVVRPVAPVRADIGVATAPIEMRCVEHEQVGRPVQPRRHDRGVAAEQVGQAQHLLG
jgi:hypothetical protein